MRSAAARYDGGTPPSPEKCDAARLQPGGDFYPPEIKKTGPPRNLSSRGGPILSPGDQRFAVGSTDAGILPSSTWLFCTSSV